MVWIIPVGLALFVAYFFWWNKFENKDVAGNENPDILNKAQTIMERSVFKRKGLFMRPMIIDPSNMAASIKKNENTGGQPAISEKPSDTAEKPDASDAPSDPSDTAGSSSEITNQDDQNPPHPDDQE